MLSLLSTYMEIPDVIINIKIWIYRSEEKPPQASYTVCCDDGGKLILFHSHMDSHISITSNPNTAEMLCFELKRSDETIQCNTCW